MLYEFIAKVKKYQKEIILVFIILLISLFSFAIGYIVANYLDNQPIQFINTP